MNDWITRMTSLFTRAAPVERTPEQQAQVDLACNALTLYHFSTCPYCAKVHRALRRLALKIEERNIRHNPDWSDELRSGGGKTQVPCLRIEGPEGATRWMYESDDIVAYLKGRFG